MTLAMLDRQKTDVAISAHQLSKKASRGPVYGPLDLEVPVGSITLVTGPDGSGKTSLLLTLTGRMKPSAGQLQVLGYTLPIARNAVQHKSAAIGILGLDDLDDAVTVAATLRERQAWLARWYAIVREPSNEQVHDLLAPYFGDLEIPTAKTRIHQLDEAQNLMLRISLAMLGEPQLIVVDQIDQLHEPEARDAVWAQLRAISESGVTVVVSATNPHEADRLGWGSALTTITLA